MFYTSGVLMPKTLHIIPQSKHCLPKPDFSLINIGFLVLKTGGKEFHHVWHGKAKATFNNIQEEKK